MRTLDSQTGQRQPLAPAGGTVTLRRLGRSVRVEPVPPAVLAALRSAARVPARAPDGCVRVLPAPIPLHDVRDGPEGPVLIFPAGLEPVVRAALRDAGHRICIEGRPLPALPPPDVTRLASFGVLDPALLAAVHGHPRALVRHDPAAVDPARLVAQVALAWPGKKVAAVVREIPEARGLRDELRRFGLDARAVSGKNEPPAVGQVVVATPMGLGHTPVAVEWLDVVVVVDALAATGKRPMECLSHAWRARMYGLLPAGARPSPLERDLLACLFGFAEVRVPGHGCRERPVQTALSLIEGGPELPLSGSGVRLKRRGLWHNGLRNRRAARLAAAFRENNRERIRELLGDPLAALPAAPGVLVLVENVEHALALAGRLPGWAVRTGPDVHGGGLSAEQAAHLHPHPDPFAAGPFHAIVTAAALPGVDLTRVGVLVRADGGTGLPPLGPAQLVEPDEGPARPLLLIDLHDRHHPALRRQTRRRQDAYADRGWFAPGVDPVQARAERFLADRP
jgi:hypothetical protein